MLRVGAVTACGENPTQARRPSCCQRERDSRSVIAMSENTPENPQDQQPHGSDPLEAQTPEAEDVSGGASEAEIPSGNAPDASSDDVAEAAAEPAEREESFSAAAIVNAPPTTDIDEAEAGSDRPTHQSSQHPSSQAPPDEAQSPTRAFEQSPTRAYEQPPASSASASSASASPAGQDTAAASGAQPGQDIPAAPGNRPEAHAAAT